MVVCGKFMELNDAAARSTSLLYGNLYDSIMMSRLYKLLEKYRCNVSSIKLLDSENV